MAVGNINELPENILLELFTHVPARQLLLRCRLVCSLWRDLIDLVTLWKRKCLREGFITEDWDQPVADWKIFYFLRSLRRNLLHNPCAEEGFEFWSLDVNGGDEWKVEDLSRDQRKEFPNDQVRSQARLRVQVPAVCSAPVVSACASGDLPARPSNDPAEERCQVEGGHYTKVSTWIQRRLPNNSKAGEQTGAGTYRESPELTHCFLANFGV
uniref:F-box protein 44 n=1 Tax=Sus scrofa TaxID=9823 RepID=A0A8D1EW56_PIG